MKINNFLILIATISLSLFSCADLEDISPINSIPTETAITTEASAKAALNGVYSEVQDADLVFDGWLALPQFFSDEANATGTFPTRLEFGNLNVFPANNTMATVFSDLYEVINVANNVIALVPGVSEDGFTDAEKNNIVAEAKFLRAMCYLHLVTLWQDVPLVLVPTVDVGDVLNVVISSKDEIYNQIKTDLNDAVTNLTAPNSTFRASQQSANALLARVALYQGNWAEAQSKAESVLGAGFDLTTVPYLSDQIYSLNFTTNDGNSLGFFYGTDDLGGRYSIGPSTALIAAFEPGDARFAATIDSSSFTLPYGLKYPSFEAANAGVATDPIYFIRHAEMVLIAAEAAAEQGDFDTASTYFNQVRTRAGLAEITLDADNYVDTILKERFTEFAFEGPQRLIDLRRRGKAEEVLGPIGYDACDAVWPLPQRDVDRNVNLQQNNCCNC